MRLLIALASLAVVVGAAVPAHADPSGTDHADPSSTDHADPSSTDSGADASFLAALRQAGITYSNGDNAVAAAKTACGLMDDGQSEVDVIKNVTDRNPGFTVSGAAKFTAIAASAYCPQYLGNGGDSGGDKGGT
jgi:hypothetical protein